MFSEMLSSLKGFSAVEALIQSKFHSDAPLLSEIPRYLFSLGGKRIRPALALMSGKLFGMHEPAQELIEIAAGIELIHMATLLHDDIIDKSPLRRHQPSPFVKFGTDSTLLSGDFLLVRAFSLCAHLDKFIIDSTEQACVALTEGEILEIPLFKKVATVKESQLIAEKKTAALFWLATLSGAHISETGPIVTEHMGRFGQKLGVAFQILDDILDVTSPENLLGKKSGGDLIERKPSLVNVLWLESGSPLSKELLTPPSDNESKFVELALKELRGGKVVADAQKMAVEIANQARNELTLAVKASNSSDSQMFSQLEGLINFTLSRMG